MIINKEKVDYPLKIKEDRERLIDKEIMEKYLLIVIIYY